MKLYTRLVTDPKWRTVPVDEFGVFTKLIILGGISTKRGVILGTDEQIAALLGCTADVLERTLARLAAAPFKTVRRLKTGLVWTNWEEHNPPSNFDPDYDRVRPGSATGESTPSYSVPIAGAIAASPSPSISQDVRTEGLVSALRKVRGWPWDDVLDEEFARQIVSDFADRDLLLEVRKFGTWVLDHPFKANSSPRSRFRNWCANSRKFAARDALRGVSTGKSVDVDEQLAEQNRRRGLA